MGGLGKVENQETEEVGEQSSVNFGGLVAELKSDRKIYLFCMLMIFFVGCLSHTSFIRPINETELRECKTVLALEQNPLLQLTIKLIKLEKERKTSGPEITKLSKSWNEFLKDYGQFISSEAFTNTIEDAQPTHKENNSGIFQAIRICVVFSAAFSLFVVTLRPNFNEIIRYCRKRFISAAKWAFQAFFETTEVMGGIPIPKPMYYITILLAFYVLYMYCGMVCWLGIC